MKQLLLTLSAVLTFLAAQAQAPFVQWQHTLGSTGTYETGYCIDRTSDSGYVMVCVSDGTNGDFTSNYGYYDIWVVRMTSWGDVVWKKKYGGGFNDFPTFIVQTSDGGYIFSGYTTSNDTDVSGLHGATDCWVVKLDDTGRIQWQRTYGGSDWEAMSMIRPTADGGYIAIGQSSSVDGDITFSHGFEDIWVLKLSATGAIQWQKSYGGSAEEDGTAIMQTADGGYIMSGNTKSTDGDMSGNHGDMDVWVMKLDDTGAVEWQHCYGGTGVELNGSHDYPGNIAQTQDGGYMFTCFTASTDGDITTPLGGNDSWVVKLSASGAIQWQKTLGGTGDDYGYYAGLVPGGGYIIANVSESTDGDITAPIGQRDMWIVKLTTGGSIEWQRNYGGTGKDEPFYISAVNDSSFIMCGLTNSGDVDVTTYYGGFDVWVAKLAYCNLPSPTAITGVTHACAGNVVYLSNSTPGGIWTASNGNATVFGGMVTAVYAGNVAIHYAVANSCGMGGTTRQFVVDPLPTPVITQTGSVLSTTTPFITYQWIKDGVAIAGATSATYTVTAHAAYSVTVTNGNGCIGTTGLVEGVSVSLTGNDRLITIAPNPATDIIYIHCQFPVVAQLYNGVGQLVRETNGGDSIGLSGLPAGMYLLWVYDEHHNRVAQEKVLKE